MMKHGHDVPEAQAIECLELSFHPGELRRIARDVRVERDEEIAPVAEGKCRISGHPARGSFERPESRPRGGGVSQAGVALGAPQRHAADIMIADRKEVRHASFMNEPLDQRREADVPLVAVTAGDDRVARLQYESNREPRMPLFSDCGQHTVDDVSVAWLDD